MIWMSFNLFSQGIITNRRINEEVKAITEERATILLINHHESYRLKLIRLRQNKLAREHIRMKCMDNSNIHKRCTRSMTRNRTTQAFLMRVKAILMTTLWTLYLHACSSRMPL